MKSFQEEKFHVTRAHEPRTKPNKKNVTDISPKPLGVRRCCLEGFIVTNQWLDFAHKIACNFISLVFIHILSIFYPSFLFISSIKPGTKWWNFSKLRKKFRFFFENFFEKLGATHLTNFATILVSKTGWGTRLKLIVQKSALYGIPRSGGARTKTPLELITNPCAFCDID